jgi:menaquinone-dependent protoporphyrinogen oxidase
MSSILILFATTEGHTARIAERIAQRLRDGGHGVELHRADVLPAELEPAEHDGMIVGSSIHYGHHPKFLNVLVRRFRVALTARPSAFFSVSLSAGGPGAKPEAARRYLETFLNQVDWHPPQTATFAGALQYSKYGAFKRLLMRMIVGIAGGDTDMTQDYEYTDWIAVDRFTDEFAQRLQQG